MARQKTQYNFTINCSPAEANDLILQFLSQNGFQLDQDGATQYYRHGSSLTIIQSLEYAINGDQVTIYAYLGRPSKPVALTDGLYGALYIAPYKAKLQPLFEALASMEAAAPSPQPATAPVQEPQPAPSQPSQPSQPAQSPQLAQPQQTAPSPQRFKSGNDGYAIAALIMSILSLILAFTGRIAGGVSIIATVVLAVSALKSNKRNLAIAALIIMAISAVVIIVKIIREVAK